MPMQSVYVYKVTLDDAKSNRQLLNIYIYEIGLTSLLLMASRVKQYIELSHI